MATLSLKPYEAMNPIEVMTHWTRVRYQHCLSLYESPNHVLWALVNEAKGVTLQMWDTNTGAVVKKPVWGSDKLPPEDRDPTIPDRSVLRTLLEEPKPDIQFCKNCGHEVKWERVAVPPRWEHVHAMARDNSSRLFWVCECGCMKAEPKEAEP